MPIPTENLGPAETLIQALMVHADHLYHNRPGIVVPSSSAVGVQWSPATTSTMDGITQVFQLPASKGNGTKILFGILDADGKTIRQGPTVVGQYKRPGIFPEVAEWLWAQITTIWQLDNELAARWASYAFAQDRRDLKVILAAFMLVQNRMGEPVKEGEEVIFYDVDFRDVGEAMALLMSKDALSPKMLLRIREVLCLPQIAAQNHRLNFGDSDRHPFLGRWPTVVKKWLQFREVNPPLLHGLVKAGLRSTVQQLASAVGYKPATPFFFRALKWRQKQAKDGRRTMIIGEAMAKDSWADLSETQICQRISKEKPSWKVIVGKVPAMTRAIIVAALEAGSIGDKEVIILQKTFEEFGLLEDKSLRKRTEAALAQATDTRAAHVAKNVRSKDLKETLEAAADAAVKKAVEKVTRNLRIYVFVDISGSMSSCIEQAKPLIAAIVQAIPLDRVHVAVFESHGRALEIPHASTKGVEKAFQGIKASGGTSYASGIVALQGFPPKEEEDVLFVFVGDEQDCDYTGRMLVQAIQSSPLRPQAFGLLHVGGRGTVVSEVAKALGIPCFSIQADMLRDTYAAPNVLRDLMQATPVSTARAPQERRQSLVQAILATPLLQPPVWA